MDLKERIKQFSDSIGFSIREFERACGLSRGNISNMTGALGSDKLTKIIDTYPELNLYWLLTGQGDMIRNERLAPVVVDSDRDALYKEIIASKDKTIATQEELIRSLKHQVPCVESVGVGRTEGLVGARSVGIPTVSGENPLLK